MQKNPNIKLQEENELKKIIDLFTRHYKFFIISVTTALILAYIANRFLTPIYKVSASLLIREEINTSRGGNVNEYINQNLFGENRNFQNELWILKSSPVIDQTIKNLDLFVNYYSKEGFQYRDAYQELPFRVYVLQNHVQPVNIRFEIAMQDNKNFIIKAKGKDVNFRYLDNNGEDYYKENWEFIQNATFGELIETPELAFVVQLNPEQRLYYKDVFVYNFTFSDINSLTNSYKDQIDFNVIQRDATVIEITLKTSSIKKGKDIVNEIMDVYSQQNLDRKNHIAGITIEYIEKQLNQISDSLSQTESNLQAFRSSNQLLDVSEQSAGISAQYRELENQLAEMLTRKRYYEYVSDYLTENEDYSDMIVPAAMGINDQLLNNLMAELVTAQNQRSNLIQNNQEKNPLVQKLDVQIENTRRTISENIGAAKVATDIQIDELNKRIRKVEAEIKRLPNTQRKLGGIERKYRLNDAIYNYLLEKRAEAKITKASNMPDNIIIEPAHMMGNGPISPNNKMNYLAALVLGLIIPLGFLLLRSILNNKVESQENIETITNVPVLGKILHNRKKSNNVVFEYPKANITESFRSLRTNLEYQFREFQKKVIMVTSSIQGEGKSFMALNLAMSYAQLGQHTLLIDLDLRKKTNYFHRLEDSLPGLSSYLNGKAQLQEIIFESPHERLSYIPSGPIPPNPIELLAQGNIQEILTELKGVYDCIILDTSPLAQVSDAYLLFDHSEVKVIVARYNYTLKKVLSFVMKDLLKKNINHTCVVLNDNRVYSDQYGYGYGYNKKNK